MHESYTRYIVAPSGERALVRLRETSYSYSYSTETALQDEPSP